MGEERELDERELDALEATMDKILAKIIQINEQLTKRTTRAQSVANSAQWLESKVQNLANNVQLSPTAYLNQNIAGQLSDITVAEVAHEVFEDMPEQESERLAIESSFEDAEVDPELLDEVEEPAMELTMEPCLAFWRHTSSPFEGHEDAQEELHKEAKLFFSTTDDTWESEFHVQVGDNFILDLDGLIEILESHHGGHGKYVGCMQSGVVIAVEGKHEWWQGGDSKSYFHHASGSLLILSKGLARCININIRPLQAYAHDDIAVSSWMKVYDGRMAQGGGRIDTNNQVNGFLLNPNNSFFKESDIAIQMDFTDVLQPKLLVKVTECEYGGGASPHTQQSQELPTASVVMNMLDATVTDTLNDEKKRKALTAIRQGETLMKALQKVVPEDVSIFLWTSGLLGALQALWDVFPLFTNTGWELFSLHPNIRAKFHDTAAWELAGSMVASFMTVWNILQSDHAAKQWNEALNNRLGTEGLDLPEIIIETERLVSSFDKLLATPEQDDWVYSDGKSTSCVAYSYNSRCLEWVGDLMDAKKLTHVGGSQYPLSVLYIWLAASELPASKRTKITVHVVFVIAFVGPIISGVASVLIWIRLRRCKTGKPVAIQGILLSFRYRDLLTKSKWN